jgi:ribokinase
MPSVLVAGGVNMDTTYRVDSLPKPGETVNTIGKSQAIGGKGLNQALAVRRAGSDVGIVGSVGDDADGHVIREFLEVEGISCDLLSVLPDTDTGRAIILVDNDAENLIIVDLGANLETNENIVEQLGKSWSGVRAVVANGETPADVVRELFEEARTRSVTTIWNPSPMPKDVATLLGLADTLIVNFTEAAQLVGRDATPVELGQALVRKGPVEVVLTLGKEGSQICTRSESTRIPAPEVDAIDPTAAGDTFLGYYVSSRLEGLDPSAAALTASKAAALCVQCMGASDSIPTRDLVGNNE